MRDKAKCNRKESLLFAAGFAAVLVMALPYLLLGQDAVFACHDQLDGEVIAYLLRARHLFDGNTLPEFLGGAAKTALMPPAPACTLLFLGGNAFGALSAMQILGSLFGYVGMYLLVKQNTGRALPAALVGVLYGYLPFLPVYGLAQYGLPLLLYFVLEAGEGRHRKSACAYAVLFALNSSLALVGFAVLAALGLWILVRISLLRKGRIQKRELSGLVGMWGILAMVYLLENLSLIVQVLGLSGEAGLSHKNEYILSAEGFWNGFLTALWEGGQHSQDFHGAFSWAVLAAAVIALLSDIRRPAGTQADEKRNDRRRRLLLRTGVLLGWNVFFALTAALWNAEPGIRLRSRLQALGAFQLDRFLWLSPCLWYLMLACALALGMELSQFFKKTFPVKKRILSSIALLSLGAAVLLTGGQVLLGSNLKPNVQKLRNPDYAAFSLKDYYAVGVLSQVEDFLEEQTGQGKEEYRVVSLGIDPAAALYHGFYCLDGYSNNYSLEYKRRFRRVIAPELMKSEYLKEYFDGWGNRCYLLSAECPAYYTVEKGGFFFADYELDVEALKDLGGDYLFSAAYIANAEEQGLTLLREEPFETEDSYYRIYVYGF